MKLVFIHGRSQGGKDPVELAKTWETSFEEGLANANLTRPDNVEIVLPFYGDMLDQLVEQADSPTMADVAERGVGDAATEIGFYHEFLSEIAEQQAIGDEQIEENYEGDVRDRGPMNWRWVHALLRTLDKNPKLGKLALDKFTRDVFLYLTNAGIRRRVNNIVAPHISGEKCVVVGHSLGSVVGYDILRDTTIHVPRYITLGSPLGMKAIRKRLQRVELPPTTSAWYNARDPHDMVALNPLDDNNFNTTPPITNYNEVVNETDNQHGIIGYLPNPWVAKTIHEALTHT